MRIIPVIDLKGGQVVRAHAGDRDRYAPIETPLAPGSAEPVAIARAIASAYPDLEDFYIADLDAITGAGLHRHAITTLRESFPAHRFLIDAGPLTNSLASELRTHASGRDRSSVVPVFGSENIGSVVGFEQLMRAQPGPAALSLDHQGRTQLGPAAVFDSPSIWPATVIHMQLGRVGTGAGPDFDAMRQLRHRAGPRDVLAAGGVRGAEDLRELSALGCGALVSTCLHNGALSREDVQALKTK